MTMTDIARTPAQIGNSIRNARRNLGLTQMQLAEMTAQRQATISRLENGLAAPKIDVVLAILAVLDLEFRIGPRTGSDGGSSDAPVDLEDIF